MAHVLLRESCDTWPRLFPVPSVFQKSENTIWSTHTTKPHQYRLQFYEFCMATCFSLIVAVFWTLPIDQVKNWNIPITKTWSNYFNITTADSGGGTALWRDGSIMLTIFFVVCLKPHSFGTFSHPGVSLEYHCFVRLARISGAICFYISKEKVRAACEQLACELVNNYSYYYSTRILVNTVFSL